MARIFAVSQDWLLQPPPLRRGRGGRGGLCQKRGIKGICIILGRKEYIENYNHTYTCHYNRQLDVDARRITR